MAEFRTYYSPEDTIGVNLQENAERFERLCEQALGHIRELSIEIAKTTESISELLVALPDHAPSSERSIDPAVPAENTALIEKLHTLRFSEQKILLCLELEKQLSANKPLQAEVFFSDAEELTPTAYNRVLYQKSTYTDSAYLRFAPLLSAPRASYAHSFPAACEEVFNGLCEYCILPIENTSEGALHSFSRLIERYELKVAATCEVSDNASDRTTRFALLGKNLTPFLTPEKDADFFAFSVPSEECELSDILTAARLCGLRLQRLDFLPASEQGVSARVTLRIRGGNLSAFLLYLAMELPHHTPIGIYSNIQGTKKFERK